MSNPQVRFEIRALPGPFGAEVIGLDTREPLPEDGRLELQRAWNKFALLLFRDQSLTAQEQLRLARVFGEIETENPEPLSEYVSNVVAEGLNPYGELGFHHDNSAYPKLLRGIMLYSLEVPPEDAGGDTLFADARAAYRNLPGSLRSRISGLTIRHGRPDRTKREAIPGIRPEAMKGERPLVLAHPVTNEPQLFLSRRHADRIVELPAEESGPLIDELSSYISRPEVVYRHVWRERDLLIWDNIALQHGRTDFDPKWRRHLRRTLIGEPATPEG